MSRPRLKPDVYQLPKEKGFITQISTNTTNEYVKVVFVRTKVRITPLFNEKTYETDVSKLKREFESSTLDIISNNSDYEKEFIFNVSIAEKSVQYRKNSHLHYDLFLKPKKQSTLLDNKSKLEFLSHQINDNLKDLFKKYNLLSH